MKDRPDPRILVVDDEEAMRQLLMRVLGRGGYKRVVTASSGDEARRLLAREPVDLIITDMQMPGGSGLELISHVHRALPQVAILMVTGSGTTDTADKALALGAYGYIIKPFRSEEVLIAIHNALLRSALEKENAGYRHDLEERVDLRTKDLQLAVSKLQLAETSVRASRTDTIERLAMAGEFRDQETGRHVIAMSRYCEILARAVGADDLSDSIREASSLHDVGKIGIPDSILLKPAALSADERLVMQTHSEIGHRLLAGSDSPLLQLAAEIALTHHERVGGSGYPYGLSGSAIPLGGRIAAIADVFDALTTDRIYRKAVPIEQTVEMMKKESGTHFDPALLREFWRVLPQVLALKNRTATANHQGKGRSIPEFDQTQFHPLEHRLEPRVGLEFVDDPLDMVPSRVVAENKPVSDLLTR